MKDLSIIIPSRNEKYLQQTINDVMAKAEGSIEVIVVLDGYWPTPPLKDDPRLKIVHHGASRGMRGSINNGVSIAMGKYLMKSDAHCMFDKGFDTKMASYIRPNWVVVPRRKRLDAVNWQISDEVKPDVDYEYLTYPNTSGNWTDGLHGRAWSERAKERAKILIDDNMSAQGSCWFMHRDYFNELELEDEANYGSFSNEFQEIGLKCWLSGGRVVTNKKTWYAHFHKTEGRGYSLDGRQIEKGAAYINRWLTNTAWHRQTLPFTWLIERFWPVPGWPEDKSKWTP
jgi:glycosyltransferase involved in cell wall biosynthesis